MKALALLLFPMVCLAQDDARLTIRYEVDTGRTLLQVTSTNAGALYQIEASEDLKIWGDYARMAPGVDYLTNVPGPFQKPRRYFRIKERLQ